MPTGHKSLCLDGSQASPGRSSAAGASKQVRALLRVEAQLPAPRRLPPPPRAAPHVAQRPAWEFSHRTAAVGGTGSAASGTSELLPLNIGNSRSPKKRPKVFSALLGAEPSSSTPSGLPSTAPPVLSARGLRGARVTGLGGEPGGAGRSNAGCAGRPARKSMRHE